MVAAKGVEEMEVGLAEAARVGLAMVVVTAVVVMVAAKVEGVKAEGLAEVVMEVAMGAAMMVEAKAEV